MFAACVVGIVVFGFVAFVLVRSHEKGEFAKAIQRQARRESELMAAIREVLSAEVTDGAVLSEAKRLFSSLSPTGRRVLVTGVYDSLLSCLARQPGNTELRVNVLEIGRLAYGSKRPEGVPTIYDEQAVQNDILVRTSGAQPATAQPALQPATLPAPTTYQLHDLDFRPGKTKAVILTVTVLGIVALLVGVVVNSGSADGGIKPSATTERKPTEKKSGQAEEQTPTSREDESKAVPYRVVGVEDNSIGGRKRTSVKIAVEDKSATPEQVHSTLLKVARSYGGDAVFVFGYWPGDDWRGMYTAGRLEWGKDGKGWSSSDQVPADGKFDTGDLKSNARGTSRDKVNQRGTSEANENAHQQNATESDSRKLLRQKLQRLDGKVLHDLEDIILQSIKNLSGYGIKEEKIKAQPFTDLPVTVVTLAMANGEKVSSDSFIQLVEKVAEIKRLTGLDSYEEVLGFCAAAVKCRKGSTLSDSEWKLIEKFMKGK